MIILEIIVSVIKFLIKYGLITVLLITGVSLIVLGRKSGSKPSGLTYGGIVCIVLMCAFAVSSQLWKNNPRIIGDQGNARIISEKFFKAANTGSAKELYALFSKEAKNSNPQLEEQTEYFIKKYKETFTSPLLENVRSYHSSMSRTDGKEYLYIDVEGELKENGRTYHLLIRHTCYDDKNPKNVGVKYILIRSEDSYGSDYFKFPEENGAYIILNEFDNYIEDITEGCAWRFGNAEPTVTRQQVMDILGKYGIGVDSFDKLLADNEGIMFAPLNEALGEPTILTEYAKQNRAYYLLVPEKKDEALFFKVYYDTDEDNKGHVFCMGITGKSTCK